MSINIKDENLLKILQIKMSAENINDINKIEEISISDKNLADEKLNINLFEISNLKNLKSLSIKFFEITDEIVECLNSLEHLECIKFLMCDFKNTKSITKQLKKLIVNNCKEFKLNMIENNITEKISIQNSGIIDIYELTKYDLIKVLKISECTVISLPKVSMFKNIEKLYLNSINLDLEFDISEMKKLKFVSLNGSKTMDKEKYLQNLKSQNANIEIEFEDTNLPIE